MVFYSDRELGEIGEMEVSIRLFEPELQLVFTAFHLKTHSLWHNICGAL